MNNEKDELKECIAREFEEIAKEEEEAAVKEAIQALRAERENEGGCPCKIKRTDERISARTGGK